MQKLLNKYALVSPFFLVIYFVLHEVNANYGLIPVGLMGKLTVRYLLIALILNFIFYLLFRNWKHSAFVTTIGMMFFLFFGAIHDSLKSITDNSFLRSHTFLFSLIAACMIIAIVITKKILKPASKIISLVLMVIIILAGWEIIYTLVNAISSREKKNDLALPSSQLSFPHNLPNRSKPDIFFMVFDAYTSSNCLKNDFNYSNPLDSMLTAKGFFISQASQSNYPLTPFSIASTFNMNYLEQNLQNQEATAKLMLQGAYSVYHSQLPTLFERQGYKIDNYSTFDLEGNPAMVKAYFDDLREKLIDGQTMWGRFNSYLRWNFIQKDSSKGKIAASLYKRREDFIKNYIGENLQGLDSVSKIQDSIPHFVYCHVMLPHEPYLFRADGSFQPRSLFYDNTNPKEKFLEQTIYTNSIITGLLDRLIRERGRPYLVILEGDHGFRDFENRSDKNKVFQNLNAYYFSDHNYDALYDGISPVNSFRVVLNKYFNQQLPLLKDSSIYVRDPSFNFEKNN